MENLDRNLGLYIHMPFCRAKCLYCDFNSFSGEEEQIKPYIEALKSEIRLYEDILKDYKIKTVFIGGGTPSYIDTHYIYEIINLIRQVFNLCNGAEISIESNPGTLSYEKLVSYKAVGINRLSIGLQAWQNRLLKFMGRIHSAEEFVENYNHARKAGFKNINIDLIFGLPGQTINDWRSTLDSVIDIKPEHLSCYSLKIEKGTPFGEKVESGELIPVEDEMDREMYYIAIDKLENQGFKLYEISNFAKPGYECRHNLIYWTTENYIGLGAGAHSYFENKRYNNLYKLEDYIDSLRRNVIPSENFQHIDREESIKEFIILGLRLINGINVDEFKMKFGEDIFKLYGRQIDRLLKKELIESSGVFIKLTPLGLDLANHVFEEFL